MRISVIVMSMIIGLSILLASNALIFDIGAASTGTGTNITELNNFNALNTTNTAYNTINSSYNKAQAISASTGATLGVFLALPEIFEIASTLIALPFRVGVDFVTTLQSIIPIPTWLFLIMILVLMTVMLFSIAKAAIGGQI